MALKLKEKPKLHHYKSQVKAVEIAEVASPETFKSAFQQEVNFKLRIDLHFLTADVAFEWKQLKSIGRVDGKAS